MKELARVPGCGWKRKEESKDEEVSINQHRADVTEHGFVNH